MKLVFKLTARGAIAVILVVALLGNAIGGLTGSPVAAGATFVAGCLAGVLLVNPRDLLSLVVTPPLIYFVATLIGVTVRALGADSMVQTFGLGMFTELSTGAPWLFGGSALVLAVALRRGLPANVRDLRDDLRSARPGAEVPRPRISDDEAFAPEPEGYFEPTVYGTPRDATDRQSSGDGHPR
ncbi:DUF6542 domain-containing protein [Streptosporangium soli]|nr:hypothetical protein [Streptosporangium sp. KLBMP 9127]